MHPVKGRCATWFSWILVLTKIAKLRTFWPFKSLLLNPSRASKPVCFRMNAHKYYSIINPDTVLEKVPLVVENTLEYHLRGLKYNIFGLIYLFFYEKFLIRCKCSSVKIKMQCKLRKSVHYLINERIFDFTHSVYNHK